jgi:glucokinase
MALTVGIDVGGTKIAAGVVDEDGRILVHKRRPTPVRDVELVEQTIIDLVNEFVLQHPVDAVGIGTAGFVDETRSRVLFAPNLGWTDEPLRRAVEGRTGLRTVVENDANAAAWGEYRFGAGDGQDHLVLVTVGTGIGGGIVVRGRIHRGAGGVAAEIGHLRLVPDGLACACGQRGCWEQYGSGNALVRIARSFAAERRAEAALLLGLGDGTPEGVSGPHVTEAGKLGDPVAVAAFAELASALGQGVAMLSAVLDPACFVIGGGVSDAGDLLLQPMREAYLMHLTGREYRTPASIRMARLGNDAGLVGAADLARFDD